MSAVKKQRTIQINNLTVQGRVITIGKQAYQLTEDLPQKVDVERKLIGALLSLIMRPNGNINILQQYSYLNETDFFSVQMGWLYSAIVTNVKANTASIEHIAGTLGSSKQENTNRLDAIGGEMELLNLGNASVPTLDKIASHVNIVYNTSLLRELIVAGAIIAQDARAHSEYVIPSDLVQEALSLINKAQTRIMKVTQQNTVQLSDALGAHLDSIIKDSNDPNFEIGIPIDWMPKLNEIMTGWKAGLHIIGAGSGMGKTFFGIQSALGALHKNRRVCYITLEMRDDEIMDRILAMEAKVSLTNILQRKVSPAEAGQLKRAVEFIQSNRFANNFNITHLNTPTLDELMAKIDDIWLNFGFDFLVIDYPGIETILKTNPNMQDTQHANDIWLKMRLLRNRFETDGERVSILALAQVNTNYLRTADKRPSKADISNSAKSVNAADVLAILHRPYLAGDKDYQPEYADITLLKVRNERTSGYIPMMFNEHWCGFVPGVTQKVDLKDL